MALLSAFVFSEKTDVVPTITARLEKGKAKIIEISKRVNQVQVERQVTMTPENDDFENRPRFGLMEVVYEWAKGMSFNQITDLTDVLEGTIVRVITRLDETCREVKGSARIIGDPSLFAKMQECQELIKRDVCHCASLYLVSNCWFLFLVFFSFRKWEQTYSRDRADYFLPFSNSQFGESSLKGCRYSLLKRVRLSHVYLTRAQVSLTIEYISLHYTGPSAGLPALARFMQPAPWHRWSKSA